MRRLAATFDVDMAPDVHRVVELENIAGEWVSELKFCVLTNSAADQAQVRLLRSSGLTNVFAISGEGFEVGDVIAPNSQATGAAVLFRESDRHHALLLTNRCNSYCLMCSQPPTKPDDSWLIHQALDVIRHIRSSPDVLGLSGGEPLLLGSDLRVILDLLAVSHPSTRVEVLTNGRLFSRADVVETVLKDLATNVQWLVPLYGHADFLHDFVVQSPGAFDETIAGLLALQMHAQPIQLRVVLIEPVLSNLDELCGFIGRNLPFIRMLALMACEPIGFALANRQQCEVDLADWGGVLSSAAKTLARHRIPFIFMNFPLCGLPKSLWANAHKSISDWKNSYIDECDRCSVKNDCSGLFAWHERGWKPTTIRAIKEPSLEQIH